MRERCSKLRSTRFLTLLAVFVTVLSLHAFTAQATRVIGAWTPIYEGVEFATGSDTSPQLMKAYALRVDLWNPRVVLYASHDNGADPGEVTTETGLKFVADHGCNVAVNASYGDPPPAVYSDIWGLTISDGVVVSPGDTTHGAQYDVQLKFTADNVASMIETTATPTGIWTAISGNAYHLVNGMALGATETVDPRTSAGISQDKRYLILICVDGRQPGYSDGATVFDMSNWMLSFGAYNAVNLDGGGSTCMTRADIGVVNKPSGGSIRPVGVHLGVKTVALHSPPYAFDNDCDGWFPGNYVSSINYAPAPLWPGCMYFDQTGGSGYLISPPFDFVGSSSEVISVRLYPQGGNSASHTLQAYWKTDTDNLWNTSKSSPIVNYTAQNGWTTVNLNVNNAAWIGKSINRLRLYFDSTNHGTRFIIDSISRAPATPPAAPTGVSASPATIHPGQSSTLSAVVGTGEAVDWFIGSVGGTPVAGQSPTVSPTTTTTYYARARNTTSGYVSSGVPVTVTVRFYGIRLSDLSGASIPTNPVRVWGKVTNASPLKINDGSAEITVSGATASMGAYVAVTGNWNGTVLTATEPVTTY